MVFTMALGARYRSWWIHFCNYSAQAAGATADFKSLADGVWDGDVKCNLLPLGMVTFLLLNLIQNLNSFIG